jgi:hypothetical protein
MRYNLALFIALGWHLFGCDPSVGIGGYLDDDDSTNDAGDDDDTVLDDDDVDPPLPLEVSISLNEDSPGGITKSGNTIVLIFDISTNQMITVQNMAFDANPDDISGSGWNDFSNLADPLNYELWEIELAFFLELDVDWAFGAWDDMSFGRIHADINWLIGAGTHTFKLVMDTSSAGYYDTLTIDINSGELLLFQDYLGNWYNGYQIDGLPVEGLELTLTTP